MRVGAPTNEATAGWKLDWDDFSGFSCSCREDVVGVGLDVVQWCIFGGRVFS